MSWNHNEMARSFTDRARLVDNYEQENRRLAARDDPRAESAKLNADWATAERDVYIMLATHEALLSRHATIGLVRQMAKDGPSVVPNVFNAGRYREHWARTCELVLEELETAPD